MEMVLEAIASQISLANVTVYLVGRPFLDFGAFIAVPSTVWSLSIFYQL